MLFFNKKGEPINFQYDEEKELWTASIHLPEVSIRLFENEVIYLIEEFQDAPSPTFNVLHGSPHVDQSASSTKITGKFTQDTSEGYKLFTIDNPLNPQPVIDIKDNLELQFVDAPGDTFDSITERLVTSNNVNRALRIDLSISSEEEGVHEGKLILQDDVGIFAEIELYTEVVGEDERFNVILQNFGEAIGEKEEFIFRKSNINEDLPDYKILNPKRKELILELHNIKPYFSGYRGIVNIIKYFGYYDLRLKEYWKNVETGKFTLEEVVLDEFTKLDKKNQLLDYPYQKTSNFGLFYDINRIVEGEFTELGLPITEDALLFSNEEIIIKLFGLKNYIRERSIGGVANIVDIIGEAFYFDRYSINVWTDQVTLQELNLHVRPSFGVSDQFGYIRDIRPLQNDYTTCPLPREFVIEDEPDIKPGNYPQCFIGFFDPILQDEPEFLDEPNIPVGFPVTLTNTTFKLAWEDIPMSWNEALEEQSNMFISWETISSLNFYEIEWTVKRVPTAEDPRNFLISTRGKIDELENVTVILPYDGFYDVTLTVYGWNNETSRHTEKSKIEVRLREADFITFYRLLDANLQDWSNNYLTWENVHSEWNAIIYENENFLIDQNAIQNRSFHIVNYIDTDDLGIPNVGIKPPKWKDFTPTEVTWADWKYVAWSHLIHEKERLARFGITKLQASGKIQIGQDVIEFPADLNVGDFQRVANILNAATGVDVESFEYTARTVDNTKSKTFVDCVSTFHGKEGDRFIGASGGIEVSLTDDIDQNELLVWKDMDFPWVDVPTNWENFESALITKSVENPFGWDDVNVYDDRFSIPIMIPLFMVVDNSRMAGKSQVNWKITNTRTGEVVLDIESFTMVYRFIESGRYTIEVTITDTNGNTNGIIKRKHVRVREALEYGNSLLLDNILSGKPQPEPAEEVFFV